MKFRMCLFSSANFITYLMYFTLRFVNDHRMFEIIHDMVVNHFTSTKDDGYVSFLTDAINVIYHVRVTH